MAKSGRSKPMSVFCPGCGADLARPPVPGHPVTCASCGLAVEAAVPPQPVLVDQAEELIQRGVAARCPLCRQLVEVKTRAATPTFVPHYDGTPQRKRCPNSGKPVTAPAPAEPPAAGKRAPGKDLSAYSTRDVVQVISCRHEAAPQIEQLTLTYLDKADRVCLQIDALREILGPDFRMRDYPPALRQPQLAVWGNAAACIIARRHEHGGYQALTPADVARVLEDLRQSRQLFFA
jgi:hypothetical protein